MRWAALICAVLWAAAVQAQGRFSEPWVTICAMGTDASAGCEAIRSREILDAAADPWRAIGRVNFSSRDIRSHCTGVLVSERLVLTAAHCLYNRARKRWIPPSGIRFAAGYQRGQAEAVSVVQSYHMSPEQGVDGGFNGRADQDWAVLELAAPLGEQVGFLGMATAGLGDPFVAGYPGLHPHVLSRTGTCTPEPAQGDVLHAICPVMMGDSGAPLLEMSDNGPQVVGILSRIAPTTEGIDALFLSADLFDLREDR